MMHDEVTASDPDRFIHSELVTAIQHQVEAIVSGKNDRETISGLLHMIREFREPSVAELRATLNEAVMFIKDLNQRLEQLANAQNFRQVRTTPVPPMPNIGGRRPT